MTATQHALPSYVASEGIRTPDPLITNQPLYLLSYAGATACGQEPYLFNLYLPNVAKGGNWKNHPVCVYQVK